MTKSKASPQSSPAFSQQPSIQQTPSSRFLIVMRHAKSDWSEAGLPDHDRPLNERGNRDAPRMAKWLADIDAIPDAILSSTSTRTRETVQLMTPQWSREPQVSYCNALYLATPEAMLATIRSDGCDAKRLMLLAHNPGVTHFVSTLANQSVDMPTAAIAVLEVALEDWRALSAGTAVKLIHYMRPKAL